MKDYSYLLFDLDGTLTDPAVGITNSVAFALARFGIQNKDRKQLYSYIGPPLVNAFMEFAGLSHEDAQKALGYYREYFVPKGIFENKPYEGIIETLRTLKRAGKHLLVATSKPEPYARRIVEHFGMADYFDFVAGASMDEVRVKKEDVIRYAFDSCGITDIPSALMIGDRRHDIEGAHKNGIDSMGVLYGYGSREELEGAGATYLVASPAEIASLILSK